MDTNLEKPKITVLMACYNSEKYLREAINSILGQTFENFEFLIINDGSTDSSASIVRSYSDPRIIFIENEKNMGHTFSLNRGLKLAKGVYIARMDSDDISLPQRFETQVAFMDSHPDRAVCGSWTKTIGTDSGYVHRYFSDPEDIRASLLFYTSLSHPSVMIRKSILEKHSLEYSIGIDRDENCEDYALWTKLSKVEKLSNIPKVLLYFRNNPSSVTHVFKNQNRKSASLIRRKQLESLGLNPTNEEMLAHDSVKTPEGKDSQQFMDFQKAWFDRIRKANDVMKIYKKESLDKVLYKRWYSICASNARLGKGLGVIDSLKVILRSLYKSVFR